MNASLQGKHVLITREERQAQIFSELILKYGGKPVEVPLLKINCLNNSIENVKNISMYEWIFFTSANGVNCFFQLLKEHHLLEQMSSCKIAVVGHKTEDALKTFGFQAHFTPSVYNAETMASEFIDMYPKEHQGRLLLVRGNMSRQILPNAFHKHGYTFDLMEVYETVSNIQIKDQLNMQMSQDNIDFITFTSPSTVRAFIQMNDHKESYKDLVCVCIGTTTEEAARQAGFTHILVPDSFTIEGMVKRMDNYVNKKG